MKMADEKKVGTVTHFYPNISVGIVAVSDQIKIGDKVRFLGKSTDFVQEVDDMQHDHEEVEEGKEGQEVGIKVIEKVREGDGVFLVE